MKNSTFSALVEAIDKKFGHTYLDNTLVDPELEKAAEDKSKSPLNAKAERKGG